jgi:O-antigen ligase/tetratricopeptide (TPR) repeat protein
MVSMHADRSRKSSDSSADYAWGFGFLLLTLTPLIHDFEGFYRSGLPKYLFVSWLVIGLSLLLVKVKSTAGTLRISAFGLALTGFISALVLSQSTSHDPRLSLYSTFDRMDGLWFYLVLFLLYGLGTLRPLSPTDWKRVGVAWVGTSLVVALVGLLGERAGGASFRITSSLGNASNLSHYLLASLVVLFILVTGPGLRKYFLLVGFVAVVLLTGLFFTFSRTTFLGLLLGLGTYLVSNLRPPAFFGLRQEKRLLGVMAGVVLVAVALGTVYYERIIFSFLQPHTLLDRFRLWQIAVSAIAERPWLGWGIGNYTYVYEKYHEHHSGLQTLWYDRAHNVFLDWFVQGGIVAGTAYLLLWGTLLRTIWQTRLSRHRKALLTAWVGMSVFFLFFNIDNLTNWLLFILVALYLETHLPAGMKYLLGGRTMVRGSVGAIAFGGSVVGTFSAAGTSYAYWLCRRFALTEYPTEKLALAQTLAERQHPINYSMAGRVGDYAFSLLQDTEVPEQLKTDYTTTATRMIEEEMLRRPPSLYLLMARAGLATTMSNYPAARTAYQSMLNINPAFTTAWIRLGYLAFTQKDFSVALNYFERADSSGMEVPEAALMVLRTRLALNPAYDFMKELNQITPAGRVANAYLVSALFREANRMPDYLLWIWEGGYYTGEHIRQEVLYEWAMCSYETGHISSLEQVMANYSSSYSCSPRFAEEVLERARRGQDPSEVLLQSYSYCGGDE